VFTVALIPIRPGAGAGSIVPTRLSLRRGYVTHVCYRETPPHFVLQHLLRIDLRPKP
jgi:hypothetical protein